MNDGSTTGDDASPVLAIDTYSVFFRAHHALPPMNTASGAPTAALYGFCAAVLKELRERRPRALAFALDAPAQTFRQAAYPAYKAHRDAAPSDLVAQFGPLRELLAAFGVPALEAPGFEADDILATLASPLRRATVPTLLMSGDRDLLQLAHGSVGVLFVGARGQKPVCYNRAKVLERFELEPERLPAYVAFVGDSSDNLPKTPGIGPRTAAKWIKTYGDVDGVFRHIAELEPARLRSVVFAHERQIRDNERLATLRVDVPLGPEPHVRPLERAQLGELRRLFEALEFKSLIPRLDAVAEALPFRIA